MDYEYYYYQAKNRYYDACSEINSCQNNVNNLEGNKQVKISGINNLKAQLKKYKDALSDIENAIKKEDDMQSSMSKINSSVDSISENFNNMAYSDSVTQKNLKDVYSTEADKTKSTIKSTFETLKSKKSIVTNKISELEVNIQRSEKEKFGINPTPTHWEIARDEFLQSALEDIRKFNMSFARSYCIGDLENDGCKIIKRELGKDTITAMIDFEETESKLCSIVVFNGKRDFTNYYLNKKNLCFEAYADKGINCVDIELHLKDIDMPYEVYMNEDEKEFKLPLIQFCDSIMFWQTVSEIKFVFHRKMVSNKGKVTIKNLRIE